MARTRYVYDGWQLIREIDATTETVLAEYVHGPGYVDDVIQSRRAGQLYYHHTDQQYSTTALTDATGAVAEYYQYDAFGAPLFFDDTGAPLTASAVNNPILYTGRPWDTDLALYDYRNRNYDPYVGRFTTPDPIGAHSDWNNLGNPYTYVANNPGAYVDPYGEALETVWDAASLGIGLGSLGYNLWHGRFLDAGLDAIGVVADAAATAIPFVPGGAGVAIRGYRATTIVRTLQHVDTAISMGQGVVATVQAVQAGDTGSALISGGVTAFQAGIVGSRALGVHARRSGALASATPVRGGAAGGNRVPLALPNKTSAASGVVPKFSQGKMNALRGNEFQRSVNAALGVERRNITRVSGFARSGQRMNVEPDLFGGRFGVTEIRDRLHVSFTKQMQVEADVARRMGVSYNLIVSPRTKTIARSLQQETASTGGVILQFNPLNSTFSSIGFERYRGNRILR